MVMTTTDNREQYAGNDSTTVFPYGFKIEDTADMIVYLTDATGDPEVTTTLVLDTDYSVSGAGEDAGGNVTYPISGDELPTNWRLTILRATDLYQSSDFNTQGGMFAETIEDAVDKLTMQVQDNVSALSRVPQGEPYTDYGTAGTITVVTTAFGRDGDVEATAGDYNASQVTNAFDSSTETSDDITEGSTQLFLTEAEQTILGNTSNTNTGDMTDADVKTAYEANADTNALTDAEKVVVGNTSNTNTGDMSNADVKTAYEANADTNAFEDADESKLDGIEASADVTDATNVAAAGAVLNTGNETVAGIKTFSSSPIVPAPTTDLQASTKKYVDDNIGGPPEGTNVKSTGETGAVKFLREDGDNTCSWQVPAGTGDVSKVGTPVDGQVGVWTGDGTIEGTAEYNYGATGVVLDKSYDGLYGTSVTNSFSGATSVAGATHTVINDQGYWGLIGMTSSGSTIVGGTLADTFHIYNQGYADTLFTVDGNKDFVWYTDPTDQHDFTALSNKVMSLSAAGVLDLTGNITLTGTVDGIDIATDVAANTLKVTNATHSGEVTGSGALTIADNIVDEANLKMSNSPTNDYVITADDAVSGGMKWAVGGAGGTFDQLQVWNFA